MTAFYKLAYVTLIALLISSCLGDHIADPENFPAKYKNVNTFLNKYAQQPQTFTLDATQGGSFTSAAGSVFDFQPNSFFDKQGNLVSGNIELKVIEIRKKSEMFWHNNSTITNNGEVLESGGMYKLTAQQNGGEINLDPSKPYSVEFPSDNISENMELFSGLGDTATIWIRGDTSSPVVIDSSARSYVFKYGKLHWVNIDKFGKGPFTSMSIKPISNKTIKDVFIFLIMDESKSALNFQQFTGVEEFKLERVPLGKIATIVALGITQEGIIAANFHPLQISDDMNFTLLLEEMPEQNFIKKLADLN